MIEHLIARGLPYLSRKFMAEEVVGQLRLVCPAAEPYLVHNTVHPDRDRPYRSVSKPEAFAAYAKLSGAAITAAGGRILARGLPSHIYEAGLQQRTVVIEFDSVEHAMAAHDSAAYQEAMAALDGGAERDIRIVEGV